MFTWNPRPPVGPPSAWIEIATAAPARLPNAARAALQFGFDDLGLDEIVSFTAVVNERSQRVMQKIGMTRDPGEDFDHPMLAEFPGVERLPGAHCYEVFAGGPQFMALQDAELGTFYLTDFLARHFDALVWTGLGLDRHPELRDLYFGAYRRVVFLGQAADADLVARARAAADRLGLTFEQCNTGRDGLGAPVRAFAYRNEALHAAARE